MVMAATILCLLGQDCPPDTRARNSNKHTPTLTQPTRRSPNSPAPNLTADPVPPQLSHRPRIRAHSAAGRIGSSRTAPVTIPISDQMNQALAVAAILRERGLIISLHGRGAFVACELTGSSS